MSREWHFTPAQPGDRARESQVEKFSIVARDLCSEYVPVIGPVLLANVLGWFPSIAVQTLTHPTRSLPTVRRQSAVPQLHSAETTDQFRECAPTLRCSSIVCPRRPQELKYMKGHIVDRRASAELV